MSRSKKQNLVPYGTQGYISKGPIVTLGQQTLLGEGTYGSVYKINTPNGEVAIKLTSKELDGALEDSTFKEMCILSSLNHPNVVRIIDAFAIKKHMGIILPLATEDFHHYLNRLKPAGMPLLDVKIATIQLARGISYIQSRDILNGDYKPSNILVHVDPDCKFRLVISDFGLAGTNRCFESNVSHTVFTYPWRAPELFMKGQYRTSADTWALGMIVLEMLTNEITLANGKVDPDFDALYRIFIYLGLPNEITWPGVTNLPGFQPDIIRNYGREMNYPPIEEPRPIERRFTKHTTRNGIIETEPLPLDQQQFVSDLLILDPNNRLNMLQILRHPWLSEANNYLSDHCIAPDPVDSVDCDVALFTRQASSDVKPLLGLEDKIIRRRGIIYSLIMNINRTGTFSDRCLGLTIYILERYIALKQFGPNYYTNDYLKSAIVCLHIAASLVENNVPYAADLIHLSGQKLTVPKFAIEERIILHTVGIDLYIATSYDLSRVYGEQYGPYVQDIINMFIALSYFTRLSVNRDPDLVALVCVFLACAAAERDFVQVELGRERYGKKAFSDAVEEFSTDIALMLDISNTIREDIFDLCQRGTMKVRRALSNIEIIQEKINPEYLHEEEPEEVSEIINTFAGFNIYA